MSLLLDLLTVLIFAAAVVRSWRRGLVRAVIETAGYLLALIAANLCSLSLGNWLYQSVLAPLLYNQVSQSLAAQIRTGGAQSGRALPISNGLAGFFAQYGGESFSKSVSDAVGTGEKAAAGALMNTMVEPILLSVSRVIAFFAVFFLCLFVVHAVARLSDVVFHIPIVRELNRLGGAAFGAVKGVILLFLLSTLVAVLIPVFSLHENPPITNNTISATSVFKYVYQVNPLSGMLLKKA
jgi:uncharacterized membrane protein required for colicin V production